MLIIEIRKNNNHWFFIGMIEIDLWYDGNIDYHVYFNGVIIEYPMY